MPSKPPQPTQLTFDSPFGRIVLHESALTVFREHRQSGLFSKESGGQLFASLKNGQIDVVRATVAGNRASRSRFSFKPNRDEEQAEILKEFGADLHLIGDWHTHPEKEPTPSATDFKKATEILAKSTHELKAFCVVVVGTAKFPKGIWCGFATGASLVRADPINNPL
jgi:integrative and conjugative element protein (TIGR02256 family)